MNLIFFVMKKIGILGFQGAIIEHERQIKAIGHEPVIVKYPEKAMMLAVKGMIPDTVIGRDALTRVRIYRGAEHNHAAQKPQAWTL